MVQKRFRFHKDEEIEVPMIGSFRWDGSLFRIDCGKEVYVYQHNYESSSVSRLESELKVGRETYPLRIDLSHDGVIGARGLLTVEYKHDPEPYRTKLLQSIVVLEFHVPLSSAEATADQEGILFGLYRSQWSLGRDRENPVGVLTIDEMIDALDVQETLFPARREYYDEHGELDHYEGAVFEGERLDNFLIIPEVIAYFFGALLSIDITAGNIVGDSSRRACDESLLDILFE